MLTNIIIFDQIINVQILIALSMSKVPLRLSKLSLMNILFHLFTLHISLRATVPN